MEPGDAVQRGEGRARSAGSAEAKGGGAVTSGFCEEVGQEVDGLRLRKCEGDAWSFSRPYGASEVSCAPQAASCAVQLVTLNSGKSPSPRPDDLCRTSRTSDLKLQLTLGAGREVCEAGPHTPGTTLTPEQWASRAIRL